MFNELIIKYWVIKWVTNVLSIHCFVKISSLIIFHWICCRRALTQSSCALQLNLSQSCRFANVFTGLLKHLNAERCFRIVGICLRYFDQTEHSLSLRPFLLLSLTKQLYFWLLGSKPYNYFETKIIRLSLEYFLYASIVFYTEYKNISRITSISLYFLLKVQKTLELIIFSESKQIRMSKYH